jgi:hypothetical protein
MDMEMERRFRDLEQRLEQEASQRQVLESELKDQQETVEAVLEMLDKTITVEVSRQPSVYCSSFPPLPFRGTPPRRPHAGHRRVGNGARALPGG